MAKLVAMLVAGLVVSGSVLAQQPNSDLFRCELSNGKTVQISLHNGVPLYEYGASHGSQMSSVELALPKTPGDKSQIRVAQISYSGGGGCITVLSTVHLVMWYSAVLAEAGSTPVSRYTKVKSA